MLERDSPDLWDSVDRVIDRATVSGLLANKLGPLGADRLRRLGRPVPSALQYEERAASVNMLTAVPLLQRIRASCKGPMLVFKGPEVARLYPSGARRFGDLDLLVADAEAAQSSLLAAGFVVSPDPEHAAIEGHHHLQPLKWPVIPLRIEVHSRPNWPPELSPPDVTEIFAASVPTPLGVDGVLAPSSDQHALLLAAHAWRDVALDSLRDVIDIAAVADGLDRGELAGAAKAWGSADSGRRRSARSTRCSSTGRERFRCGPGLGMSWRYANVRSSRLTSNGTPPASPICRRELRSRGSARSSPRK